MYERFFKTKQKSTNKSNLVNKKIFNHKKLKINPKENVQI